MSSVSDSSRLAGTATVTAAVPFADPEVAVIVAVPSATEVTKPLEDTVATEALDELHDTLAPLIVAPFWSLTVAASWDVSPSEEKLKLVADSGDNNCVFEAILELFGRDRGGTRDKYLRRRCPAGGCCGV